MKHIHNIFRLLRFSFLWALLLQVCPLAAQTSDEQFRRPLREVLADIQNRYGITLRYPEELVKGRTITYAEWRFRPDVEQTLSNVLGSQDLSFTKEGEGKYKIQAYQYHLKTPAEGKAQLDHLAALYHDRASWELRKDSLRTEIRKSLRLQVLPLQPGSRPILSAVRTYGDYSVQNLALETLPGVWVCGSIYRPVKSKGKLPVILNPDGHFSRGRYREDCQYRCAMQAKMGAIAFSYDLFGWEGESILQIDPKDHRRAGVQIIQTLNAIRILDYLLRLKDADPTRVAVTGASGGGSQTMLLTALDDRIKLSAPVAMLSSYHSGGCPCESGMGIHLSGKGTNNAEIGAMAAPRPLLVVSDGKDWTQFTPQNEFPFLQRIYGFYHDAQVQNVHLPSEGHDYGPGKRKAVYEFLVQQFGMKPVRNAAKEWDETGVMIEPDTALKVFGAKGERLPSNALKGFDSVMQVFESQVYAARAAAFEKQRYKVAVVDLMMLKRQKAGAIALTREVGADGVEVDMGGLGNRPTFDNQLRNDSIRYDFIRKSNEQNVLFASLSMSGYYAQSFCQRAEFLRSIEDCIHTMKRMQVKVGFLPLGVQCDLVKKPGLRDSVIARLKLAGKMAEEAGVVIGIETALDAKGEKALLLAVGSPAIRSYFNFSNALKNGRDVSAELKILGKDHIAQIHCTDDDGVWLQNNTRLDLRKVKQTLDAMGWSGWLVIERSRDAKEPGNVRKNFSANTKYVTSIFQNQP